MKYSHKVFGAVLILALASLVVVLPSDMARPASQFDLRSASGALVSNQSQQESSSSEFFASEPVTPSVTLPASELPAYVLEYTLDREINPRLSYNAVVDPTFNPPGGPDPLLTVQEAAPAPQPDAFGTPLLNFNGQGYTSVNPPDTIGDVGPGHYIQMINGTGGGALVQIYNKATGAPIGSQFALDGLATSGNCQSGAGDPIVVYDNLADRWLLSEFASSGNHLCVYVSTGANPGGTYYFYDFTTPTFPDYPKYAVWPDAYYVSSNETNPTAYALNRPRMLSGMSATFQRFTAPRLSGFGFQSLTPADLDGATPPPAGAPGLFMRHRDTEVHGPAGYPSQDILETYAFHVDWATPANSTFTKLSDILTAEFDSTLCGLTSFSCIPQPGTSVRLDPLREVIMWRLGYRNFGSREVLVGNFATDVNGSDRAGVRWFELRKTGTAWTLYQEGTYAPGTTNRWMGGIAMDGAGNIALGYNVSSSSDYPGVRYAGRLASDALGTLPQGEHTLVNGTASNISNRYGDYSAMSVDPADDCTFWFTGEWNAAGTWSTRIGKFKFDQCGQVSLLPRAYLPLIVRNDLPTWTNIATEDFEGSFPQAGWQVEDNRSGYGEYYWAKRACRPRSGTYSGWAVGGGADGSGLSCGSNYADNVSSWLIYGPFSLMNATDAEMLFDFWVKSELNYDVLFVGASINGNNFYGSSVSGDTGGWGSGNLDLTNVYTLGNLLGQPSVWIAFIFATDYSVTYPEGAYVDNIVLHKRTGSMAGQPTRSLSCDVIRQAGYVLDPCTSLTVGVPSMSSK